MATPPIPNTVRYEMNAENQFMLCRSCRNHLGALGSNCYGQAFDGLVCLTADNVRTDETPTSLYDMPAVNVYCNGCNTRVGGRIILPNEKRFHGRYLFLLDRMLYWDGTRGLRDAATHNPVNNDPRPLKNESPENKS